MRFEERLTNGYSKASCLLIRSQVLDDPSRMSELMSCFFSDKLRICQRSAWVVGNLGGDFPELLKPYMRSMVAKLENPLHSAIVRNTLRTWQDMQIPEVYMGEIFERCIQYIANPKEAIAVRAFSITVCANICKTYPELFIELDLILTEIIGYETSAAVLHRAKKILNR
jgi:hypothetical protein